jgi:uncharacterized protein YicC (UPF0701 family)
MIRSMTGFGEAEVETPAGILRAEVRTVNHRFFSLNIRNPTVLDRFEPQIREWLKAWISRGHVNVTFRLEGQRRGGGGQRPPSPWTWTGRAVRPDLPRVEGAAGPARRAHHRDARPPGRPRGPGPGGGVELDADAVRDVTDRAAAAAIAMREAEGRASARTWKGASRASARPWPSSRSARPPVSPTSTNGSSAPWPSWSPRPSVDEDRIAREIAIIADRWDISEEIVRLRAHMDHFRAMLEQDAAEPVGKRLGFLDPGDAPRGQHHGLQGQ